MIDNPNTQGFYSESDMIAREKAIPRIQESILLNIEDLKQKIKTEEPFPESNQCLDSLVDISDKLNEILGAWYY